MSYSWIIAYANGYRKWRYNIFKRRYELGVAHKVCLAFCMACLTGIGAQIKFYLPFTPVPITAQVFLVLLSGVLLGRWYGGLSQGLYAIIGTAGIPWFAGWKGGISVIMGVTGGYIIGFVIASFLIGWFIDTHIRARTITVLLPLMIFGVIIIYGLGALQLSLILGTNFQQTMILAVLPFIPLDIVKAVGAAAVGYAITPRETYNREVDIEQWKNWKLP